MPRCWILFPFFLSQILFHFLLSASTSRFPWEHTVSLLHFYISSFLGIDSSSFSSRYLQSNQIISQSALEKNQNIWVLASVSFFLCLCFLNLFGSGHDWKSRFPSWWIPQLWMFLRFSCTGCWATLTRPWFFQERLDHRIIEATPNLVFYGCMELVKNATVILNPIFYWHNSMIPLAHSPTETGELHGLLFAHYIF